jgi:hypothetical protein
MNVNKIPWGICLMPWLLIPTHFLMHTLVAWARTLCWARELNPNIDMRHLMPLFEQAWSMKDWTPIEFINLAVLALVAIRVLCFEAKP